MERVLTGNGACCRSHTWRDTPAGAGIRHKRTRPHRPRADGRVERFHRAPAGERACARPRTSETERAEAFTGWLHHDDHHRSHTAVNGPPATRVPDLSGQYA
ncbi:integrase core domain-containing protein [Nocardiopsis sp. NPDC101807]|uniref:integrase core domain-containing protein n=1 Tax=Nocardiopsis sp. NPDC101807 TaxID=3364339 RepID=UPI0037F42420